MDSPNLYEPSNNSPVNSSNSGQNQHSNSQHTNNQQISHHSGQNSVKVSPLSAKQRDLNGLRSLGGDLSAAVAELAADLNTPELSFDLQQFISSEIAAAAAVSGNLPVPDAESISLFNELLEAKARPSQLHGHHHQNSSHHNNTNHGTFLAANQLNSSFASYPLHQQSRLPGERFGPESSLPTTIKREPLDTSDKIDFADCPQNSAYGPPGAYSAYSPERSAGLTTHRVLSDSQTGPMSLVQFGSPSSGLISGRSSSSSTASGMTKKQGKKGDKGTDEYKKRRERNNIAVRKSREKAKVRSRETEKRVGELQRDNESLRKRVDMLTNQLTVLKNLLSNVGVPTESIDNEIARALQMDGHL
ncbi:CCAAT/enhancer-binding protein beta [Halotydeus destructor]|nr:CCAAT/enhancer-binding protein beta [Halotydeus destructor]